MADRRTRGMTGSDLSRTNTSNTAARALAIAEQLHHECSILLELYRKKESFAADVPVSDSRLVSVPPPSSQLDTRDQLWRLHSALLQCRSLMERAIAKEEEELDDGRKSEYETQRKMVKDRLSFLLITIGELLKAADGTVGVTPSGEGLELDGPTVLFELKLWVYRIFKEVDYWTKTAITTLQALPSVTAKERARTRQVRSTRRARR
ncbi:ciliary neurotrophic factor [Notolabrus celidotus]|uniref:ciliary neurotrophic factor n=1 Tax=Notolabrus celidotus TaxID=1203425 RepID=UPI00148F5C45|nr:ciliary neurotrophic factor [Notolabrus celidotus]